MLYCSSLELVFTAADKSLSIPVIQADKLEAPVITLDDHNDFLLSWNEITGVDGYKLKVIADQNENTIDIPSGTASYNLDVIDWKGYVCSSAGRALTQTLAEEL